VPPPEQDTAWAMYANHPGYPACRPQAMVLVVRHDVPDDSDDGED
jgi:hypothetical protein